MSHMLSMRHIHKKFASVAVLDDVEFEVESGEVHALLGANGAGKSTLIKVLGGQYPDARGITEIDGKPVDLGTPASALRAGIGIVHQEFDLVPQMTVAENIFLGLENRRLDSARPLWQRIDRRSLTDAAQRILDEYELGLDPGRVVGSLSAGAQQIAEIARVLALQSDVMIFDEPTARLGHKDRDRLFAIFAALRRSGKKVVFVTHYLDEVIAVADRASVMRDGRMVARLTVADTSVEELSRCMVGSDVRRTDKRAAAQRGDAVLDVRELGDGATFDGASLSVAAGEIVGLVGHLGSGRHELTRCILSGRGKTGKVALKSGKAAGRGGRIGYVPEHRRSEGIFADLSVATNIAIGFLTARRMAGRLPRGRIRRTAAEAIRTLQIKTSGPQQKVGQLSGGNQQKVVFARSMVSDPVVYVIEAPTVGVDVKAAVELHAQIFGLAERGAGVLLASDDLDEVISLSDRILVMLRGRIVKELDAVGCTRDALVVAMGAD